MAISTYKGNRGLWTVIHDNAILEYITSLSNSTRLTKANVTNTAYTITSEGDDFIKNFPCDKFFSALAYISQYDGTTFGTWLAIVTQTTTFFIDDSKSDYTNKIYNIDDKRRISELYKSDPKYFLYNSQAFS